MADNQPSCSRAPHSMQKKRQKEKMGPWYLQAGDYKAQGWKGRCSLFFGMLIVKGEQVQLQCSHFKKYY